MKNFKGLQYGDYLIEDYIGKGTWRAKCQKCGLERTYKTANIKPERENGGQCPCSKSGIEKGMRFGRLTILERDLTKKDREGISWLCECDCGNITTVKTKHLKSGNTKSCGCYNKDKAIENIQQWNEKNNEDLVGQIFTKLTVIRLAAEEEIERRPKGPRYWVCQCECGNTHIASTSDLKRGKVASCGCMNSKGEAIIAKMLFESNISFCKQITFDDLKSESGKPYVFDFAVLKGGAVWYLIEFDGIQHYDSARQFGKDKETFEKIKRRDSLKNKWCEEKRIPLIRIPYTKLETLRIEDLLLETSKYIMKGKVM
jgi:hypothetical protein